MKKILTLFTMITLLSVSSLYAKTYSKVGCVNDDQGDRYSLSATSPDRVMWAVQGNTELAVEPGVAWRTVGRYDTITKRLTITLYNPNPDNCRRYADSVQVVLRYIGNTFLVRNGKGNYYNYCSGSICCNGFLVAAAVQGTCGASPRPAFDDNGTDSYGGVGSTSNLPPHVVSLPENGVDFNALLTVKDANIYISPNPASGRAQILMSVDQPSSVDIRIYDQFGRLVRTLNTSTMDEGSYSFNWDLTSNSGSAVENGLYIVIVKTDDNTITNRIMVTR